MATSEILGLQWLEHPSIFNQAIIDLRNKSSFTDATLACEGKFYPVHKFVLSTCSEYFNAIFEWTPCVNPVVVINNISSYNLEHLLDFMYRGETNVQECYIQEVMRAAECLHIKGLSLKTEDLNLSKNRSKSPVNLDEPQKKRRKSETTRKPPSFLKPQTHTETYYGQQVASPLQSSISSTRPTPTPPPTTPVHHSSPHHTPPIHSPSLHSASPLALSSSASSPASQSHYQSAPMQIPSPKSLLSPMANMSNQSQNHHLGNVSQFKDSQISMSSQTQNLSQPNETYSQSREHYSCLKEEQTNIVFSSLPSVVSSSNPSALSVSPESSHYRKNSSNDMSDRIQSDQHGAVEAVQGQPLTHMPVDQKMLGIGEELHLEGPVKELEITTEDGGTVSIPEILEGFVDMRQLYDSKEVNKNMYEFTEDFPDDTGITRMKLLKEKSAKVYSNSGSNWKRKHLSIQSEPAPSSSDISHAITGSSPTPSGDKTEVKGPFVCETCKRVCKKKDSLTRHMRTHSEFPYTCTVCSHKCKLYKEFILHRKIHATKHCDKCDFVAIRNDTLRRHMTTHSKEKTHKCPYSECDFSTGKPKQLSTHIENSHAKESKKDEP